MLLFLRRKSSQTHHRMMLINSWSVFIIILFTFLVSVLSVKSPPTIKYPQTKDKLPITEDDQSEYRRKIQDIVRHVINAVNIPHSIIYDLAQLIMQQTKKTLNLYEHLFNTPQKLQQLDPQQRSTLGSTRLELRNSYLLAIEAMQMYKDDPQRLKLDLKLKDSIIKNYRTRESCEQIGPELQNWLRKNINYLKIQIKLEQLSQQMLLKTIYRIEVCYMIINGFESDTDENNVDQFFPEIEDIQQKARAEYSRRIRKEQEQDSSYIPVIFQRQPFVHLFFKQESIKDYDTVQLQEKIKDEIQLYRKFLHSVSALPPECNQGSFFIYRFIQKSFQLMKEEIKSVKLAQLSQTLKRYSQISKGYSQSTLWFPYKTELPWSIQKLIATNLIPRFMTKPMSQKNIIEIKSFYKYHAYLYQNRHIATEPKLVTSVVTCFKTILLMKQELERTESTQNDILLQLIQQTEFMMFGIAKQLQRRHQAQPTAPQFAQKNRGETVMTNNFVIDVIESELYKVKGMKPHMKQVATDILAYLMLSVHSFKKQLAHPMEGKQKDQKVEPVTLEHFQRANALYESIRVMKDRIQNDPLTVQETKQDEPVKLQRLFSFHNYYDIVECMIVRWDKKSMVWVRQMYLHLFQVQQKVVKSIQNYLKQPLGAKTAFFQRNIQRMLFSISVVRMALEHSIYQQQNKLDKQDIHHDEVKQYRKGFNSMYNQVTQYYSLVKIGLPKQPKEVQQVVQDRKRTVKFADDIQTQLFIPSKYHDLTNSVTEERFDQQEEYFQKAYEKSLEKVQRQHQLKQVPVITRKRNLYTRCLQAYKISQKLFYLLNFDQQESYGRELDENDFGDGFVKPDEVLPQNQLINLFSEFNQNWAANKIRAIRLNILGLWCELFQMMKHAHGTRMNLQYLTLFTKFIQEKYGMLRSFQLLVNADQISQYHQILLQMEEMMIFAVQIEVITKKKYQLRIQVTQYLKDRQNPVLKQQDADAGKGTSTTKSQSQRKTLLSQILTKFPERRTNPFALITNETPYTQILFQLNKWFDIFFKEFLFIQLDHAMHYEIKKEDIIRTKNGLSQLLNSLQFVIIHDKKMSHQISLLQQQLLYIREMLLRYWRLFWKFEQHQMDIYQQQIKGQKKEDQQELNQALKRLKRQRQSIAKGFQKKFQLLSYCQQWGDTHVQWLEQRMNSIKMALQQVKKEKDNSQKLVAIYQNLQLLLIQTRTVQKTDPIQQKIRNILKEMYQLEHYLFQALSTFMESQQQIYYLPSKEYYMSRVQQPSDLEKRLKYLQLYDQYKRHMTDEDLLYAQAQKQKEDPQREQTIKRILAARQRKKQQKLIHYASAQDNLGTMFVSQMPKMPKKPVKPVDPALFDWKSHQKTTFLPTALSRSSSRMQTQMASRAQTSFPESPQLLTLPLSPFSSREPSPSTSPRPRQERQPPKIIKSGRRPRLSRTSQPALYQTPEVILRAKLQQFLQQTQRDESPGTSTDTTAQLIHLTRSDKDSKHFTPQS